MTWRKHKDERGNTRWSASSCWHDDDGPLKWHIHRVVCNDALAWRVWHESMDAPIVNEDFTDLQAAKDVAERLDAVMGGELRLERERDFVPAGVDERNKGATDGD